MEKTLKVFELRLFADEFFSCWEKYKTSLKLGGKALYNLIGLKKELEKQLMQTQETIITMAEQYGGQPDGKGNYQIPTEHQAEAHKKMNEFAEQEIIVQYSPIVIKESDELNPELLDLLFNYIEFTE